MDSWFDTIGDDNGAHCIRNTTESVNDRMMIHTYRIIDDDGVDEIIQRHNFLKRCDLIVTIFFPFMCDFVMQLAQKRDQFWSKYILERVDFQGNNDKDFR